jgi:hypothetical protein
VASRLLTAGRHGIAFRNTVPSAPPEIRNLRLRCGEKSVETDSKSYESSSDDFLCNRSRRIPFSGRAPQPTLRDYDGFFPGIAPHACGVAGTLASPTPNPADRNQTGEEWKTGNRKPEMENGRIGQFPISGFLSPVFHFFSVRLKTFPVRA